MDAFEQIRTIQISEILDQLGIKFVRQGKQLHLMENGFVTDGWKGDDATGMIKDFAGKRAEGDRVTFVMKHLGLSSKNDAVEWFKSNFGIRSDEFNKDERQPHKPKSMEMNRPKADPKIRAAISSKWDSLPDMNEEQREYCRSRKIDPDKISQYAKNNNGMVGVMIWDEEGALTIQNRSVRDKKFMIEPGTQSKGCFMSKIDKETKKVWVVEGMFDFLSIAQFGVNVIGMKSAMDGADMVKSFYEKGYEINIVPDVDEAGAKMHELFSEVPHFWVDLSKFEVKDVNELIVKSDWGKSVLEILFDERQIAGPLPKKKSYDIIDYVSSLEDGVEELKSTKIENVLSWGIGQLDQKLGYLMPGQLILVGGLTGSGKSTFVNEIAGNVSRQGIKVGRFVLEDRHQDRRKEDLYYEVGAIRKSRGEKNFPKSEFMVNAINDRDSFERDLASAKKNLSAKFKNILDVRANTQERMKIDDIGPLVKDFVAKGCKLIIIDHLHYFKISGDAQRYDLMIENAMQYINAIARDYSVTVVLVAHYKKLNGGKPDDESFKDSVAISQVPNKVIHVHRDKMSNGKGFTELIISKNREGWTGIIEMNFDQDLNRYSNEASELQKKRETSVSQLDL